jgi:hypothetical protein
MTKDLGRSSWTDAEDWIPFKWVRFLRLRAIHGQVKVKQVNSSRGGPGMHRFWWLKYTGINLESKA